MQMRLCVTEAPDVLCEIQEVHLKKSSSSLLVRTFGHQFDEAQLLQMSKYKKNSLTMYGPF
jgi:hypothetical protein